jgi:hypothetical protein
MGAGIEVAWRETCLGGSPEAERRLFEGMARTADHRPEIYTQFGLDRVAETMMTGLIHRHCPGLAGLLPGEANGVRALEGRQISRRPGVIPSPRPGPERRATGAPSP